MSEPVAEANEVIISAHAYAQIVAETVEHLRTETGGILLGLCRSPKWYILESLDPGPKSTFKPAFFEYDHEYVTHIANKTRRYYKSSLQLLGLWHRHPGSMDRFSSTDDETNSRYVQYCKRSVISGLVNIDPAFRLTFYEVAGLPVTYKKLSIHIGDENIPADISERWEGGDLLESAGLYDVGAKKPNGLLNRLLAFGREPRALPQKEPEQEMSTPIFPSSDQAASLEMLDQELAHLDAQIDYSYRISLQERGVLVRFERVSETKGWTNKIDLLFTVVHGKKTILIGNQEFNYAPGCSRSIVSAYMVESEKS